MAHVLARARRLVPGRRTAAFAASVALLGLVTAVGLAWVAAIIVTYEPDNNRILGEARRTAGTLPDDLGGWEAAQWTQRGLTTRIVGYERYFGRLGRLEVEGEVEGEGEAPSLPDPSAVAAELCAAPAGFDVRMVEKECGWPMRCLRVRWGPYDPDTDRQRAVVRGGIPCDDVGWGMETSGVFSCFIDLETLTYSNAVEHTALPLVPMWPGLAVNTALFAGAWGAAAMAAWPVLALPAVVRRRVRRARGRCAACGYDLRGLAGGCCPECGRAGAAGGLRVPVLTPVALAALALAALAGLAIEQWRTAPRVPAIFLAAERGDADALRAALAAGADPAARCEQWEGVGLDLSGQTPLAWAAAHGQARAVAALLAAGPDAWTTPGRPRYNSTTATIGGDALDIAARRGHVGVCRLLLDDLDARVAGHPALAAERDERVRHMASHGGHAAGVVALAIEAGFADDDQWSLLRIVADRGDPGAVALVLEAQPDAAALTATDWDASALAAAYTRGRLEAFELLLAAGANPHAVDAHARGLLHHAPWPDDGAAPAAARRDRAALVRRAASAELGLDANARDASGKTPLMLAVYHGDADMVRALLDAGADPRTTDAQGHTALDYARGDRAFRYEWSGHADTRTLTPDPEILALLDP